jgi:hypothetical protein
VTLILTPRFVAKSEQKRRLKTDDWPLRGKIFVGIFVAAARTPVGSNEGISIIEISI